MKNRTGKYPIRLSSLAEQACLYAGCFFLAGFLTYLENAASGSYVLLRYLKFITEHKTAFILGISSMAIVYHYQGIVKARTEIRSRLIVGDRLPLIRLRYAAACSATLTVCFALALPIQIVSDLKIDSSAQLFVAFSAYITGASLWLGRGGLE